MKHYEMLISSSLARLKDSLAAALSDSLVSKEVIAKKPDPGDWFGPFGSGMMFKQRMEMFLLLMKVKRRAITTRTREAETEAQRVEFGQPTRPNRDDDLVPGFHIQTNLCLVPTFNETMRLCVISLFWDN